MKKRLGGFAWVLFGIIIIIVICFIIAKEGTHDFIGYIEEIQIDEQNECTWITMYEATNENSHIKLKIPNKVAIKNADGEKIFVDEIVIGQFMDADIKWGLVDGEYYKVKRINVYNYSIN